MEDRPLSSLHQPPSPASRVRIRMRPHQGVIGEDRTDWLGGEEHECSAAFARQMVTRGLAEIIPSEASGTPNVEHRDPAIESRDPMIESRDPIIGAGEGMSKPRPPRKVK
jgi:hypothetical protein